MGIRTTCIGAWPKPEYVKLPDWFNVPAGPDTADPTAGWQAAMDALGDEGREIIARGVAEAVHDQIEAGIDIPTDGEIARENYIHYHCRHLHGFDFVNLTSRALRAEPIRRICRPSSRRYRPGVRSSPATGGARSRSPGDR